MMDLDGLPNLPNEIITDIFIFCLPQELHPDPRNAPILLTHVCSSWRAFATNVPRLWRTIELSDVGNLRMGEAISNAIILEKFLLEQVNLWNANSRGQPLAVSLAFRLKLIREDSDTRNARKRGIISIPSVSFWDRVLGQAVVENSRRIQRLFLRLDSTVQGNVIFNLTSNCLPVLDTLHLVVPSILRGRPSDSVVEHVTAFSKAPSLRRVALDIEPQSLEIDIPWAQLTHLVLHQDEPISKFHFILRECSLLQTLSMKILSDDKISPDITPSTIIATHLRELGITMIDITGGIETFLAPVRFPALNLLRFCWCQYSAISRSLEWKLPFSAGHNHFIDQLYLLHSLTLGYQNISSDALLEILRCTPLLVDLKVDSELFSFQNFLENLTYRPETEDEILVPRLENFTLYLEITVPGNNISFTSDAFIAMIVSRSNILIQSENDHPQGLQQIRPALLKNVLLCVEKVEKELQIFNIEDLSFQLDQLSVSGLGVDVRVEVSDGMTPWLAEEYPNWC